MNSEDEETSEWSYNAPEEWENSFSDCGGYAQSPINIITSDVYPDKSLGTIKFNHFNSNDTYVMTNNGHTLQLSFLKDAFIMFGSQPNIFKALQFHFHWATNSPTSGSEHQVDGNAYPLEMHIVHRNTLYHTTEEALQKADGLAVLGFFFQLSEKRNPEMDKFLASALEANDDGININLNLGKLIGLRGNKMGNFYRYSGSLTTPPCSEVVNWTIFKTPIKISTYQLKRFWQLKGHGKPITNFRPARKLYGRTVCSSP